MVERMLYSRYKQHYADCDTVIGSYDKSNKTIEVLIPEGRMKPSGVRGKTYSYIEFKGVEKITGRLVRCTIKATCRQNAIKRLPDTCIWEY